MKKVFIATVTSALFLSLTACSGTSKTTYKPISGLNTSDKVVIKIGIPTETNKALNTVANAFVEKYPNVDVQLQYVEDYDKNATQMFKDNLLDVILTKGITYAKNEDSVDASGKQIDTDTYFYNYKEDTEIDLSGTNEEITDNYKHERTDEDGKLIEYQYSIPLGGESRGVFVNTTLLKQYGLSVPTNYAELLTCCEKLKEEGLIPIQGSVSTAAYGLGVAPAVNPVVHDAEALTAMSKAEPGVSEYFSDTMSKLYELATNRYFDYKAVEESGFFTTSNDLGQAESFLGLHYDEKTLDVVLPENNSGYVAFLPYISSTMTIIQSLVDKYKLDTDVTFIGSPLNETGNPPAYVTPYYGLSINKNSENLIWLREFINFIFNSDNNKIYADNASIIPNTKDAMDYVVKQMNVNKDTDITFCGSILFSDEYNGFNPVSSSVLNVLKCSAKKYMVNLNKDASGNIQYETDENGKKFLYLGNGETKVEEQYVGKEDPAMAGYAFCTFDYYMNSMEKEFAKYKGK